MNQKEITQSLRQLHVVKLLPIVLIALVTVSFYLYNEKWFYDPFLVLIFLIFLLGQVISFFQYPAFTKRLKASSALFKILQKKELKSLSELGDDIQKIVADIPEKTLLLNWVELGKKGDYQSSSQVLETTRDVQDNHIQRSVGLHVLLNRLTLKMGFLGTLIGLVQTFPPMKKAILGLADKDGQMQFIKDIASAIDGDEYAILTTLVATGLSILVESFSIFILEKQFSQFDDSLTKLHNWYLINLKPLIIKDHTQEGRQNSLLANHIEVEKKLALAQKHLMKQITDFSLMSQECHHSMGQLNTVQASMQKRIDELTNYEEQYRSFLSVKNESVSPNHLKPPQGAE